MFHPGVWVKNFALGKLARSAGAAAINLVIDSDAVKSTAIGLPTGSREHPHLEHASFDQRSVGIPFEDRPVRDMAMFESFGRRVQEEIATFVSDPLVRTYWPSVLERYRETNRLGASLAQARHQLEGEWGLETLELPQSRVCQTEAFAWFAAHVLAHLPRFWDVYNDAVHEYRSVYRIRSAVHPVPDLESNDGWLEAPFWLWTEKKPTRRRLFARRRGDEIVVTDRDGLEIVLNLSPEGDATAAVEQIRALTSRGVRLRTRAAHDTFRPLRGMRSVSTRHRRRQVRRTHRRDRLAILRTHVAALRCALGGLAASDRTTRHARRRIASMQHACAIWNFIPNDFSTVNWLTLRRSSIARRT